MTFILTWFIPDGQICMDHALKKGKQMGWKLSTSMRPSDATICFAELLKNLNFPSNCKGNYNDAKAKNRGNKFG